MSWWINAQVINTNLVESFTSSLWWWLLSFPDLSQWILWPLNSIFLSLSLAFWFFVLWAFILMKAFPDFWSTLSKLPWWSSLSYLKWKTWWSFLMQFTIIWIFSYMFLWFYSWNWNWNIQNFFVWKPANIWKWIDLNEATKEWTTKQWMVTVTIKPLQWIRFTWVSYDWSWNPINNIITNETNQNVLLNEKQWPNWSLCNYNWKNKWTDIKEYKECVYPNPIQWMLVVDSFSVQWNTEKSNPVNIYITNDYDWVTTRLSWWNITDFDSSNSVKKQNETHWIISVLRNIDNIWREFWTDSSFWQYIESFHNELLESLSSWIKKSDKIWDKVNDSINRTNSSLKRIYQWLSDLRTSIISWESKTNLISSLSSLWNIEIKFLSYQDWNKETITNMIHEYDVWKQSNFNEMFKNLDTEMASFNITDFWTKFSKTINMSSIIYNIWDKDSVNNLGKDNYLIKSIDFFKASENNKQYHWNDNSIISLNDIKNDIENWRKEQAIEKIDIMMWMKNWKTFYKQATWIFDFTNYVYYTNWINTATFSSTWDSKISMLYTNSTLVSFTRIVSSWYWSTAGQSDLNAYYPWLVQFLVWDKKSNESLAFNLKNRFENDIRSQVNSNSTESYYWHVKDIVWRFSFASTENLSNSLNWLYLDAQKRVEEDLKTTWNEIINWNYDVVQFKKSFVDQFISWWWSKVEWLMWYKDSYRDIVNEFNTDWKIKYLWVAYNKDWENKDNKDKMYWVWNNEERLEEASKTPLDVFLWALLRRNEKDVTFVWVEWWMWIKIRKWDVIFASPWTAIYALPYPIELMMTKELADTIEFVDQSWWTIWFYSDRYDWNKYLTATWEWRSREVWKLTEWWFYNTIMSVFTNWSQSINWMFNPNIWFWVNESWFFATFLVIISLILVFVAFILYIFKNLLLYILTFVFFVFFIWLLALDWQPKRVAKKVLAWFVALTLIPLYWYLVMHILWMMYWHDQSFLYNLRNFNSLFSPLFCMIIAYVPIMIFFWTRRFLFSLIVDWKLDTSTLTFWNFLWAWHVFPQSWWNSIDNAIKKKFNQWKQLANNTKDKLLEKAWLKKKAVNVSTTWPIWDWINDVSNNDVINKVAWKRDVNAMDVTAVQEEQVNKFVKWEFESRASKIQKVLPQWWRISASDKALRTWLKAKKLKWLKWDWWHTSEQDLHNRWNVWVMFNNTQDKSQMISWVTPDLINTINSLRNWIKEELNWTERDFARVLMMMFDQNKELLVNLSKVLEEVKNKASDPEIKEKLDDSKNTLTAKDLEIIKAIKQEKWIKWEFNQENIRKSLSESFKEIQNGKNLEQNLEKIKALNSFNHTLYNQDKEDKFYNITNSINWILSEMKNRPNPTVEKEITKYIMNWDSQWLNNYKQQNAHIEWLDILIDRIQTMPHEMMKVLNSNATAAEMRNNAAWINEFIWLMKNNQKLEELKHKDMNKYLATMLQIQEFRNSSIEDKMQMASMASVGSIQTIKEANKVTTMLSNEISRMIQSQWSVSHQSITNIVKNISWTTEISVRDQRDLTNKLKENLNQIREINK